VLAAAPAFAELGAAPTPAAPEQAAVGVRAKAAPRAVPDNYTINEIHTAGGIVTEYVSLEGVVFGISWRTVAMPDLQALLGAYFPAFQQAAVAARGAGQRGPVGIDSADLVLQSGGRMRDYRGRAYVPALLPANVAADVVQ
jgi:hypothetical protein